MGRVDFPVRGDTVQTVYGEAMVTAALAQDRRVMLRFRRVGEDDPRDGWYSVDPAGRYVPRKDQQRMQSANVTGAACSVRNHLQPREMAWVIFSVYAVLVLAFSFGEFGPTDTLRAMGLKGYRVESVPYTVRLMYGGETTQYKQVESYPANVAGIAAYLAAGFLVAYAVDRSQRGTAAANRQPHDSTPHAVPPPGRLTLQKPERTVTEDGSTATEDAVSDEADLKNEITALTSRLAEIETQLEGKTLHTTSDFHERVLLVDRLLYRFLEDTDLDKAKVVKPVDVMPYLIAHGAYTKDHREGLPLRNDLRTLDERGELHLIRTLQVERKAKNRSWSFKRL